VLLFHFLSRCRSWKPFGHSEVNAANRYISGLPDEGIRWEHRRHRTYSRHVSISFRIMRKALFAGLAGLGMVVTASATTVYMGGIALGDNYQGAYNPVVWDATIPVVGGTPVLSSQSVHLTVWFGKGILAAEQLTENAPLIWQLWPESAGYAGFYSSTEQPGLGMVTLLPDWQPGDTYTFQVRASGTTPYGLVDELMSRSAVWVENARIGNMGAMPPPPPMFAQSPGLAVFVPEPSIIGVLSLTGLLCLHRRR
jgi:hypothetical protein